MFFTFQMFRCSNCGGLLFFRLVKILDLLKGNSGLGPGAIRCSKCGAVMNTGNAEWASLSLKAKVYLWILTLTYSLLLGPLLSVILLSLMARRMGLDEITFVSSTRMLISSIVIASLFMALQFIRVAFSLCRMKRKMNEPYKTSLFNMHTNFQGLGLACIVIGMLVSFLLYFHLV